jgi:hypothetical protein
MLQYSMYALRCAVVAQRHMLVVLHTYSAVTWVVTQTGTLSNSEPLADAAALVALLLLQLLIRTCVTA